MTKLNGFTDVILTLASLYPLIVTNSTQPYYLPFFFGFGSIAAAAFCGTLYFFGVSRVRPLHLIFIQLSTSLGLLGIAMGYAIVFNPYTFSPPKVILLIILSIPLTFIIGKSLIITYCSVIILLAISAFRRDFLALFGLVTFVLSAVLRDKHFKINPLDEIDIFHIGLSFALYLFSLSIQYL